MAFDFLQTPSNELHICQKWFSFRSLSLVLHVMNERYCIHAIKIELKINDWARPIIRKSCAVYMFANDRHITMSLPFVVFMRKKRNCSTFCPKRVRSGKSRRKDFITKYLIILLWIYTKENWCKRVQTVHYDYSTMRNTKYCIINNNNNSTHGRTIWLTARDYIYVSPNERTEINN